MTNWGLPRASWGNSSGGRPHPPQKHSPSQLLLEDDVVSRRCGCFLNAHETQPCCALLPPTRPGRREAKRWTLGLLLVSTVSKRSRLPWAFGLVWPPLLWGHAWTGRPSPGQARLTSLVAHGLWCIHPPREGGKSRALPTGRVATVWPGADLATVCAVSDGASPSSPLLPRGAFESWL